MRKLVIATRTRAGVAALVGVLFLVAHAAVGPEVAQAQGATPTASVGGPYSGDCMDRTHGGRVFGDMVDTFEYVRHRA